MTTEQRLQLLIGAQAISICELQAQLEAAQKQIAELKNDLEPNKKVKGNK